MEVTAQSTSSTLPVSCAETFSYHKGTVTGVGIDSDGDLISGSKDGTVKVKSLSDVTAPPKTVREQIGWEQVLSLYVNGNTVPVGTSDNRVEIWHLNLDHKWVNWHIGNHNAGVTAIVGLQDDSKVVSGSLDKTAKGWNNASSPTHMYTVSHHSAVNALAVFRKKNIVASGSEDGIRFWLALSGTSVSPGSLNDGPVSALAVFPDEQKLVSGSAKTISIWDLGSSNSPLYTFEVTSAVHALTVFPDGTFASGHENGEVRIWDASLSGSSYPLEGKVHQGCVRALAVGPDYTLLSGSDDTTIKWWK